ncbi:MAG: hypothetical protein OK455_07505 [Thaumarchaeota archaeon]|nr:hypothetical protein [Nitrososphaerota archaeon]
MIRSISAFPENLPLTEPYQISSGIQKEANYVLVTITNQEGETGIGEASPMPGYSEDTQSSIIRQISKSLGPPLVGKEERQIPSIVEEMDHALKSAWMAKSAIEIAIHDLVSSERKLSIIEHLGGRVRDSVQVAGSIGFLLRKEAAKKAARLVTEGVMTLKVKVGQGVDADVDLVRAIRSTVGREVRLRLDANQAYEPSKAISILRRLEAFEPELFEQPVSKFDTDSMAKISRAIDTPVVADEPIEEPMDIIRFGQASAADMVKLKVNKCGGITRTIEMCDLAREFGMKVIVGSGHSSSIGVAAESAVAMSRSNFDPVGEMSGNQRLEKELVENRLLPSHGSISSWSSKGLGLTLIGKRSS